MLLKPSFALVELGFGQLVPRNPVPELRVQIRTHDLPEIGDTLHTGTEGQFLSSTPCNAEAKLAGHLIVPDVEDHRVKS